MDGMIADRHGTATVSAPEDAVKRELAERRLSALAHAVREHESVGRATIGGPRPHDALLHRRLREILGAF
jgi:hypothetical protein